MPRSGAGAQHVSPVGGGGGGAYRGRCERPRVDWRRLGTMSGLVALPVFVLDQLSKLYVSAHLKLFEQIDPDPGWLDAPTR